MIYTHVLNRGSRGDRSPADALTSQPAARWAETAYRAEQGLTIAQTPARIRLTATGCMRVRLQCCSLQLID